MKCSQARAFLSLVAGREDPIAPISPDAFDLLSKNGYVLLTSKEDYAKGVEEIGRLTQLVSQSKDEQEALAQKESVLSGDTREAHSITHLFEGKERKAALEERIQSESSEVSREEAELSSLEATVNSLIQEKSAIDRMVPYDGGYVSLTGLGTLIMNDISVRNYRVGDMELADFISEIKSTYSELRTIADRAIEYVDVIEPRIPISEDAQNAMASSLAWSTAIGLAKLQGDTNLIAQRFSQAFDLLRDMNATIPNRLMAAEVIAALGIQDVSSLEASLKDIDHQVRKGGAPKELSAGVASTILAGRRFDGSYPVDRFTQFAGLTSSYEAASILSVMNVPFEALSTKFSEFRAKFRSWGYMDSEDTEIASAFLAIGELGADEVEDKLKYIVEQLRNYLEYPLVAGAILASIPVFEAHETLDLMEKAVTLLSGYKPGLERSEKVALAVRMIHGVRNELVKKVDSTARISETPVQFTYPPHPGLFIWYRPVIVAHSYYYSTFSGMGGFHPAHSHGVGGFAG